MHGLALSGIHPKAQAAPTCHTNTRKSRLQTVSQLFNRPFHNNSNCRCIDYSKHDDVREYISVGDYVKVAARIIIVPYRCIRVLRGSTVGIGLLLLVSQLKAPVATVFACCALWQFSRPGKSHQEDYGFPVWGDMKPTMRPGMAITPQGGVASNTVVMWRSNDDEGQAEKYDQVQICFTSRSPNPILPASINTFTIRCSWMWRTSRRSMGWKSWQNTSPMTMRSNY